MKRHLLNPCLVRKAWAFPLLLCGCFFAGSAAYGQAPLSATALPSSVSVPATLPERTVVVTAVGRVDPNVDVYQRDKGIMLDDLRKDAKKQCIEKAVGTMVSARSLVQDYVLIEDKISSQTVGMIKSVVQEGPAELGPDGFMRMVMTAEVYLSRIEEALQTMTRVERIDQIKQKGNPTISVAITIRNATRSGPKDEERSALAENILKDAFSDFGYRVWSEGEGQAGRTADFVVTGEAQFEYRESVARGIALPAHYLTSWTVKCQNGITGEQILFNNQVPRGKSWSSEASAEEDIGKMIGAEFNQEFFDRHLMSPSTIYQLYVHGVKDYDRAEEIRKEFLGLRAILNAELRDFDVARPTLYEVDLAGARGEFLALLNGAVVKPLNEKYGAGYLSIKSTSGQQAELAMGEPVAAPAASASAPPQAAAPVAGESKGSALPWILVGGLVAVLVVGAVFFFRAKQK